MAVAIGLHTLSFVIWVGGMFFAYMALRPVAASLLEPPLRLTLWVKVFGRFFPWVWGSVILLLTTGLWMIFAVFGGFGSVGLYVHAMFGLGILMMLIFMHVYFAPYRRLRAAVADQDWSAGGRHLAQIRLLVGVNTALGLLVVLIGSAGRHFVP